MVYDANGNVIIGGVAPTARLDVNAYSSTKAASVFRAATSATADITEWQDSASTVLASVGPEGTFSTASGEIHIYNSGYAIGAADYERLEFKWDSNDATISTAAAGTGTQRDLILDGPDVRIRIGGTDRLTVNATTSKVETGYDFRPTTNKGLGNGASNRRWFTTYTGGLSLDTQTITASSDTLNGSDSVALCDCTSNSITINLHPAANAPGNVFHIKKTDSTSNTVTIDADGTETIDGQLTQILNTQYESLTLVSDGSNWFII